MSGNEAVRVNGFVNQSGAVDNHITERGSSWLYAVCAIMGESQDVADFSFTELS